MPSFPSRWPALFAGAAFATLALALPGVASAQSLQELYGAARGFDATYLSAKATAASAEYRVAQVEALNRPSLAATATIGLTQTDPPGNSPKSTRAVTGGFAGRMPLFNKPNNATIAQARKSLLTAQADLDAAEQDLIVRVAQAYFDVLAAQDTLGTTGASKTAITEQLASAKRNFEVGTATITDTREAQARFDLSTAQAIAADNDLRAKRIALDTLVGRSNAEPKPLATLDMPAVIPANPDEWVTLADQQHPAVRRARVNLEVAQLETEKARATLLPTVDAVASLNAQDARGSLPALSRSTGTSNVATVGVQLNWTLFSGGAVQNRIQETLVLEDRSRNDLEAARRAVAQTTRVAYFGLLSGQAQVKALEAAEASSKLALEATQLGYRVGVRVNLDVLNAQTQLFTTQRDLALARYNVLLSTLRLRQASGQLLATDIDRVSRFLAQ